MKLKKIETGMVIRCTEEQTKILQENGIVDKDKRTDGNRLWIIDEIPTTSFMYSNAHGFEYIQDEYPFHKIVEFADLVETELTAEELMDWIRDNYYCEEPMIEAFGEDICIDDLLDKFTSNEVIERIAKHIKDHEKKEPEVEWVWEVMYKGKISAITGSEEGAIIECEKAAKAGFEATYRKVCRVKVKA